MKTSSLLCLVLIACHTACASAPEAPGQTSIAVDYPGNMEAARAAVIDAYTKAGVRDVCDGIQPIHSNRCPHPEGDPAVVDGRASRGGQQGGIRARLLWKPARGITTITITGRRSSDRACTDVGLCFVAPAGGEVSSTCGGRCAFFWGRMERIADALRAGAGR